MKNKNIIILIAIFILSLALYLAYLLYTPAKEAYEKFNQYNSDLKPKLESLEKAVLDIKSAEEVNKSENKLAEKRLYMPEFVGEDTVTVFGSLFEDIIQYAKFYGLKVRSIEYKPSPPNDEIVKNAGPAHHVCEVDLSIVATYQQFQGFYKELYKYPYLINFAKIEIIPYDKNKKYLIFDIALYLYAKK